MRRDTTKSVTEREASWMTALAEADAAGRRVEQAVGSLDRLAQELRALRDAAETTVRLDLARDLTDGPDGGVLTTLVSAAATPSADPRLHQAVELLVERLTASLGLAPIAERGTSLSLLPEELGEFEVRGPVTAEAGRPRALYRVVRSGWWFGDHIVVRPLLEPVLEDAGAEGGAVCAGF